MVSAMPAASLLQVQLEVRIEKSSKSGMYRGTTKEFILPCCGAGEPGPVGCRLVRCKTGEKYVRLG